jgi:hypothetical protein
LNWNHVVGLTVTTALLGLLTARAERKRVWVVVLLLDLPAVYFAYQWVEWKAAWRELWLALPAAAALLAGWWFGWGRRLPPATTDNIKVWGQEEGPKPKPADVAALQAEILRLQQEHDTMEAELRRLKGSNGGGSA